MKKTKVLGLVYGGSVGSSHVVRVLEIAKAMRKTQKFDIAISEAGGGPYREMVEKAGFRFIQTKGLESKEILRRLDKFIPRFFYKEDVKKLFPLEDELLREEKPDIIVRDYYRELAGIAAKQYGIFDVLVGQVNVCPYYHFDFLPPNIPKLITYVPQWFFELIKCEKLIRKGIGKELHRKSRELGLKVDKDTYEGADADLTLLCDSEEVLPLQEKPDKYKYLGPLLVLGQNKSPEWKKDFAEDPRKKILVTSGSSGRQEKNNLFFETFQNGEFAVALYTNESCGKNNFYGGSPFEINSVLPYADVFITHGGMGSMYLGVKHGVPMLGLFTHLEQNVNCFTIDNLGAGLSIGPKKRKPEIIKDKVHQLINDLQYKQNAVSLRQRVEKEKNSPLESAVRYIEEGYGQFKNL